MGQWVWELWSGVPRAKGCKCSNAEWPFVGIGSTKMKKIIFDNLCSQFWINLKLGFLFSPNFQSILIIGQRKILKDIFCQNGAKIVFPIVSFLWRPWVDIRSPAETSGQANTAKLFNVGIENFLSVKNAASNAASLNGPEWICTILNNSQGTKPYKNASNGPYKTGHILQHYHLRT